MSENIQSISQGTYTIGQTSATNFIAGQGIKIDEPSAGTVRIGTVDDYIVTTEEIVGTYTVSNTGDTNVNGVFSKTGYKPIAWTIKFSFAGNINFNDENTYIDNNELHFQGYARFINSKSMSIQFKLLVTWVKVGGNA